MPRQIEFGTFNVSQVYVDFETMTKDCRGQLLNREKRTDEHRNLEKLFNDARDKATAEILDKRLAKKKYEGYTRETLQKHLMLKKGEITFSDKVGAKAFKNVEKCVASKLAQLDIICLQEVNNEDRPFIKKLKKKGFEIYRLSNDLIRVHKNQRPFSTAVAVKKQSFEDTVLNKSMKSLSRPTPSFWQRLFWKFPPLPYRIYGQEIAGVKLTVKNTYGVQVAVASLHGWGFQLYPQAEKNKKLDDEDRKQMSFGLTYIKEAIQLLNNMSGHINIAAGDMNNDPDNDPRQFAKFKNSGYETLAPDANTNINCSETNFKFRKIDYIFVQQDSLAKRIWKSVCSIFYDQYIISRSPATVMKGFDWNLTDNSSDHQPVKMTITFTLQKSLISKLFKRT